MSDRQSQEYRGNGNHTWEQVLVEAGARIDRLRVPGGWLYRDSKIGALVFVPIVDVMGRPI